MLAWRVLAAALAQAALYDLRWSVKSAAIDTSGYATDEVDGGFSPRSHATWTHYCAP